MVGCDLRAAVKCHIVKSVRSVESARSGDNANVQSTLVGLHRGHYERAPAKSGSKHLDSLL